MIVVHDVLKQLGYEVLTGSDVTNFDFLYTRYEMYSPPERDFPTAQRWTPSIMVKSSDPGAAFSIETVCKRSATVVY